MSLRNRPNPIRRALIVGIAAAGSAILWSPVGHAASNTETLRYYVKDVSTTITRPDGTIIRHPPYPAPASGDVLEINSIDFKGDHRHHAKQWTASQTQRCVFAAQGPPDCSVTVAIAGSLLIFRGSPGTLANGTGRYQRATGRVLKVDELKGGVDVVARVLVR